MERVTIPKSGSRGSSNDLDEIFEEIQKNRKSNNINTVFCGITIPFPRTITFADLADKSRHDRMVELVTKMLEIRFWPSGQRRIREEPARVLRCPRGLSEHRGDEGPHWGFHSLNKKLQDAQLEHEKELLQRQIGATDAAIDALVYELYELTEDEIKIVEGQA